MKKHKKPRKPLHRDNVPGHVVGGLIYSSPFWYKPGYRPPTYHRKRKVNVPVPARTAPGTKEMMVSIVRYMQKQAESICPEDVIPKVYYRKSKHKKEIGDFVLFDSQHEWCMELHLISPGRIVASARNRDGETVLLAQESLTDENGLTVFFGPEEFAQIRTRMQQVQSEIVIGCFLKGAETHEN